SAARGLSERRVEDRPLDVLRGAVVRLDAAGDGGQGADLVVGQAWRVAQFGRVVAHRYPAQFARCRRLPAGLSHRLGCLPRGSGWRGGRSQRTVLDWDVDLDFGGDPAAGDVPGDLADDR